MSEPLLDEHEAIALRLVGALVIVLLVAVLAFAALRGGKPAAAPAAVAADTAGLRVEASIDGVVKLFFETGKHEVGEAADAALAPLVRQLGEGRVAVVSGFHDDSGDAAQNAELAQRRAQAVQAALLRLGAVPARVLLVRPLALSGGADAAEARRVEVVLQ